jgi:hypothetical protein
MRTSPLGMRRPHRRAPLLLLSSLVLVLALGAGCSDDGDDEGSSPTITSPTTEAADGTDDDASTTTEATDETTTSEATETGGESTPSEPGAEPLTAEQATGELERIFETYRAELEGAKQRNALDEQFQAGLASVLAPALRDTEVQQLQQIGVPASLPAELGALPISGVEVLGGASGCSWGSATIDFAPFYGASAAGAQTYFFRLAAEDGAYRLDSLGFTETGEPYAGLECPEA